MNLIQCKGVVDVGKWMQTKGFAPGEHPKFGGVHPVHTPTSLHYKGLALDVNDRDVKDTLMGNRPGQFQSETQALRWLYGRLLGISEAKGWPLNEMFFDGFGFIVEQGYDHNHPIGGHDGHLHVGWSKDKWK